jgi:hypothetical protein
MRMNWFTKYKLKMMRRNPPTPPDNWTDLPVAKAIVCLRGKTPGKLLGSMDLWGM